MSPTPADAARRALLDWYRANRRDLPWRRSRDPYRVWVAEIMLIQTQVETALPYYGEFLRRFPDVDTLAAADLDDVLKSWEGLGYYGRARDLHRAARIVRDEHGGRLPRDPDALRTLPGIGPYVAAAVLSIAFGEPVVALDGNVRRVVARLRDLADPRPSEVRRVVGPWVEAGEPGAVNQALMDLGATVCTPRRPRCDVCPLAPDCLARARGTVAERPESRRRRRRPHHEIAVGVVWRGDRILIAKRRPHGLLGGLWEFPGGKREAGESLEAAVVREVGEELGVEVRPADKIAAVDHAYTHFAITLHAYHCEYVRGRPRPLGCDEFAWVRPDELDRYAFPAANRRILEQVVIDAGDRAAAERRAGGRGAADRSGGLSR